jgi:hypothetical protein
MLFRRKCLLSILEESISLSSSAFNRPNDILYPMPRMCYCSPTPTPLFCDHGLQRPVLASIISQTRQRSLPQCHNAPAICGDTRLGSDHDCIMLVNHRDYACVMPMGDTFMQGGANRRSIVLHVMTSAMPTDISIHPSNRSWGQCSREANSCSSSEIPGTTWLKRLCVAPT